jgi:hypothetical protein
MNGQILDRLEESVQELFLPAVTPLTALTSPVIGDPKELLKNRFLCRGGAMTLIGPTGIGKSTLAMQMCISWCLGQPCFGIEPTGRLKILHIQAENDEGDLAEMRDGIVGRLALTDEDDATIEAGYLTLLVDSQSGLEFCQSILLPLVRKYRPDLILLDPALSYLGGETNNQQQVGEFLRSGLSPIIHEFNCGILVVHHTNKPPSGKQKPEWSGSDFAYLGSGSAEWANWPRAILALRSINSSEVFELRLAKRGQRVGWVDRTEGRTTSKLLRHSKIAGQLFWEEVTSEEGEAIKALESKSKGKSSELFPQVALDRVPEGETIAKVELEAALRADGYTVRGIAEMIKLLIEREELTEVKKERANARPSIHLRKREVSG